MIVINEQDLLDKIYQILKLCSTLELEKMGKCEYALVCKKIEEIIRETPGLEPCPFCGEAPDVDLEEGLGFKIRCINNYCEINCESDRSEDCQKLIEQWNKRGGDK